MVIVYAICIIILLFIFYTTKNTLNIENKIRKFLFLFLVIPFLFSIYILQKKTKNNIIYIQNSSFKDRLNTFYKNTNDISKLQKNITSQLMTIISYLIQTDSGEYYGKNNYQHIKNMYQRKFYMRKITIPEGLSSAQITVLINSNKYLVGEINLLKEGTLSPGTYLYTRGSKREKIINKMKEDFEILISKTWNSIGKKYCQSKKDWIILASIVEKEGGNLEQMKKIATVFRNRLDKKMRLQSDVTVLFPITKGMYNLNKTYYKHLKIPSEFNTYIHRGLPPSPITNPSYNSLIASLNPTSSSEIFFIYKNNQLFISETFDAHIKAKNKS